MEYRAKGKYYRLETTEYGNAVLSPIQGLPTHILEQRAKKRKTMQMQRNRSRATSMNIGFVIFLSVAMILACIACYQYITVISSVTANMRQVSELESQIETVAAENANLEKRMQASENVYQISNMATAMGMTLPKDSQIVRYSVEDGDYLVGY